MVIKLPVIKQIRMCVFLGAEPESENKSQRVDLYFSDLQKTSMYYIRGARAVKKLNLSLQSLNSDDLYNNDHLKQYHSQNLWRFTPKYHKKLIKVT